MVLGIRRPQRRLIFSSRNLKTTHQLPRSAPSGCFYSSLLMQRVQRLLMGDERLRPWWAPPPSPSLDQSCCLALVPLIRYVELQETKGKAVSCCFWQSSAAIMEKKKKQRAFSIGHRRRRRAFQEEEEGLVSEHLRNDAFRGFPVTADCLGLCCQKSGPSFRVKLLYQPTRNQLFNVTFKHFLSETHFSCRSSTSGGNVCKTWTFKST